MTASTGFPLTVLTITWNGWADTRRCLQSVVDSTHPADEIVVIDNGSQDGTPAHIERLFPHVKVVRNVENAGHTRAVNQGLALATADYVLLLDSDTELAPNAIALLLQYLEQHPEVGIVAPRTYNTDGSVQLSARRFPGAINGLFGRQSLLTRWFPNNRFSRHYLQSDELTTTGPYEVEQVSAACMLFRRTLAQSVGPWDERYFAYWVDTDWCYRVRQHGWKITCIPSASVIHHEQNRAGKKKSAKRIWMFHYGAYRFYRKTRTKGALDPRAVAAMLALTLRGLFQLAQNAWLVAPRPASPRDVDPS
jgi:N-acetylglucosaminyl-diphospho-decaprenol L-rhamnosyltransferase